MRIYPPLKLILATSLHYIVTGREEAVYFVQANCIKCQKVSLRFFWCQFRVLSMIEVRKAPDPPYQLLPPYVMIFNMMI